MSTMPPFQGGLQAVGAYQGVREAARVDRPGRLPRRVRRLERYVVLGAAAGGALAEHLRPALSDSDDEAAAIARAWEAVEALTTITP